ncbi:hypothetical protein H6P81_016194 [Aristolochia fimbriata]|uniref:Uncharacterized protein n=1 Tax=Aristolochia fimbriata TaxID=158543 RepID=A0AAV7E8A3_ARIFI|nr:hypothetical protein H6P81_016194 [Aristolochia fimbriata]
MCDAWSMWCVKPKTSCMEKEECSKRNLKHFNEETSVDSNQYAIYRRCNDGRSIIVKGVELDNRWVVPYNTNILKKYDAHINVELCAHSKAIKYLYKYVYK